MNAVTTQQNRAPQTLKQQLAGDYFKQQVALALPKHMTADRFVRVALTALLKTPKLAECSPESVIQCMLNCSALGLEPDGRRAHLIPYKNVCTLVVDYKGLVELVKRNGEVSTIFAQVVCDKDSFEWENGVVTHKIDWRNPRGEPYAAYSTIIFKDGTRQSEVLTKDEIFLVRDKSSGWRAYKAGYAKETPWADKQSEPEMWKKTAFKRLSKWITLSPEVAEALEKEDAPAHQAVSIVTDLQPPTAPQPEALPTPADDGALAPAVEAETVTPAPAAEPAPAPKPDTLQDQLADAVIAAGFDYDDFAEWAVASNNVPEAKELDGFAAIHETICKRLLRSQGLMLKGIARAKGGA